MSQPNEVTRVRKLDSMGCCGPIDKSQLLAIPPTTYRQGRCSLVGPSRSLCHAASYLPSKALQVGRPVAFALPCHQTLAVKGVVGLSAYCVRSAMPPVACRQGRCRQVRVPGLPISLTEAGSTPDVRPTWRHCDVAEVGVSCFGVDGPTIIGPIISLPLTKILFIISLWVYLEKIVVEFGSLEYVASELIDLGTVGLLWLGRILWSFWTDGGREERLGHDPVGSS
ncbi:hypothetical protein GW17_00017228 [Ensete ventricosum]|nr:hypothetical protein GW17_00017228 [Ensete ventricosum]